LAFQGRIKRTEKIEIPYSGTSCGAQRRKSAWKKCRFYRGRTRRDCLGGAEEELIFTVACCEKKSRIGKGIGSAL
jgi:hypothetical protein